MIQEIDTPSSVNTYWEMNKRAREGAQYPKEAHRRTHRRPTEGTQYPQETPHPSRPHLLTARRPWVSITITKVPVFGSPTLSLYGSTSPMPGDTNFTWCQLLSCTIHVHKSNQLFTNPSWWEVIRQCVRSKRNSPLFWTDQIAVCRVVKHKYQRAVFQLSLCVSYLAIICTATNYCYLAAICRDKLSLSDNFVETNCHEPVWPSAVDHKEGGGCSTPQTEAPFRLSWDLYSFLFLFVFLCVCVFCR